MQIKTITTVDGANTVEFDESTSKYYWIKNIGNTTVYASANSTVEADADNVVVITAGNAAMIETHRNTVYILGAGKVEIHEQDIPDCFFKSAAQGGGGEGNAVSYSPTATSGVKIGELTIDGVVNNLYSNVFYGVCTTATNTSAKTVAIDGFTATNLTEGTVIVIKFTNAAHAAQAQTLNVNNTGAKSIVKYGSATAAGAWAANQVLILVYDGTYWRIADYQQNSDENVKQTPNTNGGSPVPILIKGDTTTQEKTEGAQFNSNVTITPSTGTLTANKLVGDGSGITELPITYEDNTSTAQINNGAIRIGTLTINGTDVNLYCRGEPTVIDLDGEYPLNKTYCPVSLTSVLSALLTLRDKIGSEEISPIDLRVQTLESVKVKTKTVTATHATASKAWGLNLVVSEYPNIIGVNIDNDNYVCAHFKSADKTRWYTTISHYSTPGTFVETGTFTFTVYYV